MRFKAALLALLVSSQSVFAASPASDHDKFGTIALWVSAQKCHLKMNAKTDAWVSGMIQATDNQISTSAAAAADERYRSESSKIGSAAYCDNLRAMLRSVQWL
jgi:hypothetical protein